MTTLDSLPAGTSAVIESVTGADGTVLRLLEMGLTPDTSVVITRRAPLGDPIEVEVRGTRVCMRAAQARAFRVRTASAR